MTIRAASYGGGAQSTALLVLAAKRELQIDVFVMADVGHDSENPETIQFVDQHVRPYAERHGVELVVVRRTRKTGEAVTLYQHLLRPSRSIDIPVRMANGAPGNRNCTAEFKIKPVAREIKRRGASAADPARLALGISTDEALRMRTSSKIPHIELWYPLIHDVPMNRSQCVALVEREIGATPPKSSCWFCPFFSLAQWKRQRKERPDLFAQAVKLEQALNDRRKEIGKDEVRLSSRMKPLDEAIVDDGQLDLFTEGSCDIGGYCFA